MKRFKVMALGLLVSGLGVAAAPPAQAQSIVSRLGGVLVDSFVDHLCKTFSVGHGE